MQQFPTIDGRHIYAAGHSSAGTLALLLGARDQRIQAVAAYAPVTDVAAFHGEEGVNELEPLPGFDGFFRSSSSVTYVEALNSKFIFLFHALDDEVVDPEESKKVYADKKERDLKSRRVTVESGGHYDSMIRQGIPSAIQGLETLQT